MIVSRMGIQLPSQLFSRDAKDLVRGTHCHEMTGAFNRMPDRSRHSIRHLFVDGRIHEPVIHPLPNVDSPLDLCHIESPTSVEKLTIANEPVTALRETFCHRFTKERLEPGLQKNLLIV